MEEDLSDEQLLAALVKHQQDRMTLCQLMNSLYADNRGDTYQNGVKPGMKKLHQFLSVCRLREVPQFRAQETLGDKAIAYVKLFDPCGSWTWYISEWDGEQEAFGLVCGHEVELGYMSFEELSEARGARGIGIEIDMHWTPRTLEECHDEHS